MTLIGDFFILETLSPEGPDAVKATVQTVPSHAVYRAHFPGSPITPGVLLLQLVVELAELAWQEPLRMDEVKNVKYLAQLVPQEHHSLTVSLSRTQQEGSIKVSAQIFDEDRSYAKCSLGLKRLHGLMDGVVAVIPTYNNVATIGDVVDRTLKVGLPLIVVNDGSTDGSAEVLARYANDERVTIVDYQPNKGKGYALKQAFAKAKAMGFVNAVTLDADGQHFPEDIPLLLDRKGADSLLVVGARNLQAEGMPGKNSFANQFSNFWFRLQTGTALPDTQTGFRLYPLNELPSMRFVSNRYESELALLVFSAWKGVSLVSQPVRVVYPEGRVTHFRPFWDFMRITLLNTGLTLLSPIFRLRRLLVKQKDDSPESRPEIKRK